MEEMILIVDGFNTLDKMEKVQRGPGRADANRKDRID
jgi:hypothetical protein